MSQGNSRPIKFRVWDENAKLHDGAKGAFIVCDCLSPIADTSFFWAVAYGLPITQYTGLKDKNGKDIYEGDIVKWNKVNGYDTIRNSAIEWLADEACFSAKYVYDDIPEHQLYCIPSQMHKFWEVIGNVFENPELLNPEREGR